MYDFKGKITKLLNSEKNSKRQQQFDHWLKERQHAVIYWCLNGYNGELLKVYFVDGNTSVGNVVSLVRKYRVSRYIEYVSLVHATCPDIQVHTCISTPRDHFLLVWPKFYIL